MECPQWDSIPIPLALPNDLKKSSPNTVSRGGNEHTTVPITLGGGAFPLHMKVNNEVHTPCKTGLLMVDK